MKLVVVESPTKCRTLARFLGKEYRIEATVGHIRDLPKEKLGVDVEKSFKPTWVIVSGKKKRVAELKKIAKGAKKLYLATDPDREGEAIAWHAMHILKKVSKEGKVPKVPKAFDASDTSDTFDTFQRIVFHEITKDAVQKALKSPRGIDLALVDAQKARRVLDRLVGYKLSPLLWRKIQRGLSAGRVQSVTVRLVVEKEREIEAFIPKEYWNIEAELEKQGTGNRQQATGFLAKLIQKDGKKIEVENKKQADSLLEILKPAVYKVADIKKKEVRKFPLPPFITSTMQQTAGSLLRFSTKKTMVLAQKLYEQGLITYHRTDSVSLAKEAVAKARKFIKKAYGEKYLPQVPKTYRTRSKSAQEAHEAIRPTEVRGQRSEVRGQIGIDAGRLYDLIWKRFVACQMKEQVLDETRVDIEASARGGPAFGGRSKKLEARYLFRTVGIVENFDGWRKLYEKLKVKSQKLKVEDQREIELPSLNLGEILTLIELISTQKFTQPPARYSEATLVRALEEKGIGRPSTYAPTISTVQTRQYVVKEEGKLKPTKLGFVVNDFLVKHFAKVVDYSFTAKMEDDLDEIANGRKKWVPVIAEFYQPFAEKLEKVSERAKKVKVEEKLKEKCPECGASLIIKFGRYGKFISCSKFPKCDFKKNYIEKIGQKCPECGGEIIIRKTKKGRIFYGCSNYPKCKWASWQKPKT